MADPGEQSGFTSGSQTSSITLPPNKRPRLSPGAPGSIFGSPYPSSPLVHYSTPDFTPVAAYSSFNAPQPVQQPQSQSQPTTQYDAVARPAPGTMGPPEKPKADKGTDINDLSDLVTAAGVDLREEENYLAATYRNQHAAQTSTASTSFNTSQGSSSTISPDSSFALWSQSSNRPQYNHAGSHTLPVAQPAVPFQTYEQSIRARHRDAARRQSELRAKHLNDPFLRGNSVRERMQKCTFDVQVRLRDISETTEVQRRELESNVSGRSLRLGDGSALVVARVTTLAQDAALTDILSLISLAAQERLRGLLEDTYVAGRARRYGSTGVVPPEFQDIAMGNTASEKTTAMAESLTGTAWDAMPDSAISPMTVVPLKRKCMGLLQNELLL
jgi:hypothetical protein